MQIIGLIAVLISAGCLAAIVLRNLTLLWNFFFVPDFEKELAPIDKRLAVIAGISFIIGLGCLLASA